VNENFRGTEKMSVDRCVRVWCSVCRRCCSNKLCARPPHYAPTQRSTGSGSLRAVA